MKKKDFVIVFTKSFELYLFILFQTRSKPMSRSVMVLKTNSSLKDLIESHYFGFFDRVWHSLLTWDRAHRARSEYWSYSTSCPCDKRKGSVVNRTRFFRKTSNRSEISKCKVSCLLVVFMVKFDLIPLSNWKSCTRSFQKVWRPPSDKESSLGVYYLMSVNQRLVSIFNLTSRIWILTSITEFDVESLGFIT